MASSGLSQNSKLFSDAFNHRRSSARLRSSSSDRTVYTAPGETLSTFSSGLNTPLENSTLMLIYKVRLFFYNTASDRKPRSQLARESLLRLLQNKQILELGDDIHALSHRPGLFTFRQ